MDTIIWFRDWTAADITAPQSGDAVFLLGLNYSPPIEGGLRLSVFGIAFGANAVDVTISSGTDSATATVQTATEGQFEANLTLDANAAGSTGIVVAVNAGQNASGTDRAAFVFPDVGLIELAPHRQQDVEPARLAYGAGTPDRLLYARTFVRLSHSLPWGKWADKTVFAMRDGKFFRFDAGIMQAAAETASGQDSIQARTTIHEALHRALREDSKARDQFVAAQKSKKTWTEEIAKRDKKSLKIRTTKTDSLPK